MKPWLIVGAGVGVLMAGGVAMAQNAPPPPAPPPGGPAVQMDHGPERGGMMMHGWRHHHDDHLDGRGPPPPTPAAVFRFRKGDASVFIKCADNETTAVCVDAASKLMDKLAAQPK